MREDLAQEALIAIWAKGEVEAPLRHQLRTAQNRMLSVRKLGKSVDGKLDASYRRARRYAIVSLEQGAAAGDDGLPLHDLLPSALLVEPYVVGKLQLLELLAVLVADERDCVELLCAGFTPREIVERTRREPAAVMRTLHSARRKLRPLLYRRDTQPAAAACIVLKEATDA